MTYEFRLVDIGEGLTEAEIVSWLVAVGDHVVEDQPVVEIETDKAVVEMPAPVTGTVVALGGEPGPVIAVGEVLVVIDEDADAGCAGRAGAASRRRVPTAPLPRRPRGARPGARLPASVRSPHRRRADSPAGSASISARDGTGPGGRITDDDVTPPLHAAAATAGGVAADAEPGKRRACGRPTDDRRDHRIALRGVRKRTAETMTAAWQAVPHVDSFHEIDVTDLFAVREQFKPIAAAARRHR